MISKYEALQELIENQPALGQQKLKAMLRFLQDGQVSQSELEKILTYDYKGKTEEQSELYTMLVGLVIDLYIKNNGQENFLELYNSLQGEPEQVQAEPVEEKGFAATSQSMIDSIIVPYILGTFVLAFFEHFESDNCILNTSESRVLYHLL